MKAIDKLKEIATFLERSGIEYASKEAEVMLRQGLNMDIVKIYRDNPELNDEQIRVLSDIMHRRVRREPLHYILGHIEFLGLNLLVGPGVLIPRPETEFMTEYIIELIHRDGLLYDNNKVLDVCTGTGCIAIAIAKAFSGFYVYGTDISEDAIRYARLNADVNGVKNVCFLNGSLMEPLKYILTPCCEEEGFDFIISNPPYIKRSDIKILQPEIREWEPLLAIDGGEDGLDFYRRLTPEAMCLLRDGGQIFFEVGYNQADNVQEILTSYGFKDIVIVKDYSGIERIVTARCKK
jgi:release factor glutamine methyltransferase